MKARFQIGAANLVLSKTKIVLLFYKNFEVKKFSIIRIFAVINSYSD